MAEKIVYTTMENLADQLGYKRNCLQQRLRTMGWTSEDLKDDLKMLVFIEANKSPYLAAAKCTWAVLKLRGELQELKQDHTELNARYEVTVKELAVANREIADLKSRMKSLENKVSPEQSIEDIELQAALDVANWRAK